MTERAQCCYTCRYFVYYWYQDGNVGYCTSDGDTAAEKSLMDRGMTTPRNGADCKEWKLQDPPRRPLKPDWETI